MRRQSHEYRNGTAFITGQGKTIAKNRGETRQFKYTQENRAGNFMNWWRGLRPLTKGIRSQQQDASLLSPHIQSVLGTDTLKYFPQVKKEHYLDISPTCDSSRLACKGHNLGYPHPRFPMMPGHRVGLSI